MFVGSVYSHDLIYHVIPVDLGDTVIVTAAVPGCGELCSQETWILVRLHDVWGEEVIEDTYTILELGSIFLRSPEPGTYIIASDYEVTIGVR